MAAGSTYTPIATTTLSSATNSVTFSSISGSYTDIILVTNIIPSTASVVVNVLVGNGSIDTGSNYSYTRLYGDGTSAASDRASSTSNNLNWTIGGGTSTGAVIITQLQNYSNTTTYKTFLTRISDMTLGYVGAVVSLWRSTSAINTIRITGSANFSTGSTFTLYGILAA